MRARTTTIEIDGATYQLSRFGPELGSFIVNLLLGAALKKAAQLSSGVQEQEAPEKPPEDSGRGLIQIALMGGLGREEHGLIFSECMKKISRLEGPDGQKIPMPIVSARGDFAAKDLEDDLPLLTKLQIEVLVFNFSDFFARGIGSALDRK